MFYFIAKRASITLGVKINIMSDNIITVHSNNTLEFNGQTYPCALGKNGVTHDKAEGDWATPVGEFKLRKVLYRADRLYKPETTLTVEEITAATGWCDDVNLSEYNTQVTLPFNGSHEELFRDDEVYDIIVPLGYNDESPVAGKGSAIFWHIARPTFSPTAGCVATTKEVLLEILSRISYDTSMVITE